jgi:hypothetical protein
MLFTLFCQEANFSIISLVMLFILAQLSLQQFGATAGICPLSE